MKNDKFPTPRKVRRHKNKAVMLQRYEPGSMAASEPVELPNWMNQLSDTWAKMERDRRNRVKMLRPTLFRRGIIRRD